MILSTHGRTRMEKLAAKMKRVARQKAAGEFDSAAQTVPRRRLNPKQGECCTADGSELTPDEVEFGTAMEAYKQRTGRRFPTCSEVLEVFRGLGYRRE